MQAAVKGMFALLILTKSHGALDWCDTDRLTTQKRCRVSEVNDGTNRQILNPQPKLPDTREANISTRDKPSKNEDPVHISAAFVR